MSFFGHFCASIGLLIGLAGVAIGLLAIFAGGMSDAPEAGDSAASDGLMIMGGGALLFFGCLVGLLH